MKLQTSKPMPPQLNSVLESASNESMRQDNRGQRWLTSSSGHRGDVSTGDFSSQYYPSRLPHQLAKANQFGHHLKQFPIYSQVGYGTRPVTNQTLTGQSCGSKWPLQRYPDRSVQDSRAARTEQAHMPMQTSHQPVQFIFGWVLRKMVRSTMGWLFPKRR